MNRQPAGGTGGDCGRAGAPCIDSDAAPRASVWAGPRRGGWEQATLHDVRRLSPCRLCARRMAVPGSPICTICDTVTLPALVPDDPAPLWTG